MLYLLQTYGEDFSLLKIGFSENLDSRLRLYYECNPLVKILSTREGDRKLESFMHRYFKKFKYPELNEWFYYSDEIVTNFNSLELPEESSFDSLYSLSRFEERLKYFSLYVINHPKDLNSIPESYRKYFVFTPEELESSNYRKDVLDKKLKRLSLKEKVLSNSEFIDLVLGYFKLNKVYSRKEIKAALESFCMRLGLSVNNDFKLTASDILRYFKASPTTFMDSGSGKVSSGYRITSTV